MILERELYDRDFVENWVNWEEWLRLITQMRRGPLRDSSNC